MTRLCSQASKPFVSRNLTSRMTKNQLARVYAEHHGWHTHRNGGGWIYDEQEQPVVQGWGVLADRLEAAGKIVVGVGIRWSA